MNAEIITESSATLTDQDIISQVLGGDKQKFELLMRRYNARMYRIGMSMINNDSEIEDIMQNAYIKAFVNLEKFENRSAFGTWLIKILINECLQHIRKNKHLSGLESNESYMNNKEISDRQTPANITLNRELANALEQALLDLPEKYRLVFVMREMEDMSVAETVEALDLSESNVKVRLNRAKSMLRDKLNDYFKSDSVFHFYLTRCDRVVQNVLSRI
jgi:RNA polymerase sigma-70 factor (ECF subfamily)